MSGDRETSARRSAQVLLGLGIAFDVLVAFIDRVISDPNINLTRTMSDLLDHGLLWSAFFGLVGTSVGSVMWAKESSNRTVIAAIGGLVLGTLMYESSITLGFDDERVLVVPFVGLIVLLLAIGRLVGRSKAKNDEFSAG
jgi:hypothetical protein